VAVTKQRQEDFQTSEDFQANDLLYLPNNCVQAIKVLGSGNFPSLVCNSLCGLPQNHPVSSASLLLFSGIYQAIKLSTFLPRHRLIIYLSFPYNFSIHQLLISRNLHCMLIFHSKPPRLIGCNALSLALASQFRHQVSVMRELGNGLLN